MSGSQPTPAEQHLGDRLAALVDGELNHDVRERVLAHLATCVKCKAEADAQRRVKSLFVESAPPPPSEGLLARLQGLPGGMPSGGDGPGFGSAVFGTSPAPFGYVSEDVLTPPTESGFRIHEVPDPQRASSRGRRFAFVAAGAVSLAAIALGGALPLEAAVESGTRPEGGSPTVSSNLPVTLAGLYARTSGGGALEVPESPPAAPSATGHVLPGALAALVRPGPFPTVGQPLPAPAPFPPDLSEEPSSGTPPASTRHRVSLLR
ncbi:anti-sigma factor family protein [Streptomyces sp. NPDC006879]|uniref:anti-sigma factor family protein n=1 Tax=Streptomyces sp. NPDC006879 TaxID=3364767 RepID=UPI0036C8D87E